MVAAGGSGLPDEPVSPGRALWKRYLIGTLLIVLATATATTFAAVREVDTVVDAFRDGAGLDLAGELAEADVGKPQTIMLIGSDKRAKGARDYDGQARSDTLILVRMDPEKKRTALLSLPRDLKVKIPGHGTDKINAAYSLGGAKLTLKTVKELTGLTINHVVNVDFKGFREGVDAIGCVYVDIDRTYFNNNVGVAQPYATINVKQGYQKLCGQDALDYVRYRHEDTDIVRGARQQDFLRQAKDQVGVSKIVDDRRRLTKIFGRYTESDIRSRKSVVRLLRLVAASAANPIVEVRFRGKVGASYVTISDKNLHKMTQEFLGTKESKGPRGELEPRDPNKRRSAKRDVGSLENAAGAGKEQALQVVAGDPRFPVYYPTQRTKSALFAGPPRVYDIRANGRRYRSYRMVIRRGAIGEYYGLQGTTWKDPPILKGPDETRKVGGREVDIYYDGDRVRLVAWREDQGVYWVTNTLLQTLSKKQMLSIARSARRLE
jgi:polyisoprenyl-teichoic acid--peptidoglycan teichoic acid transferase